jgi:hypothetical protein
MSKCRQTTKSHGQNRLGVFAVCRTENALCEAGVSTIVDMKKQAQSPNTTIFLKSDQIR